MKSEQFNPFSENEIDKNGTSESALTNIESGESSILEVKNESLLEESFSKFRVKLGEYLWRSARKSLKDSVSVEGVRDLMFVSSLANVAEEIEKIEQVVIEEDGLGHIDLDKVLKVTPESLKSSVKDFCDQLNIKILEVSEFAENNKATDLYTKLIGHNPVGNIKQKRILDSLVWLFENKQDEQDYYISDYKDTSVDDRERKAKSIAGTAGTRKIDGKEIGIVTLSKGGSYYTKVHERRHVMYSKSSDISVSMEKTEFRDSVHLFNQLQMNWIESLKDEILAYSREGIKSKETIDFSYLTKFGQAESLYDYPVSDRKIIEKLYQKNKFGSEEDFNTKYQSAQELYYKFAISLVDRFVKVSGGYGLELDFYQYDLDRGNKFEDESAALGLRIMEFYPIQEWPDLFDRFEKIQNSTLDFHNFVEEMVFSYGRMVKGKFSKQGAEVMSFGYDEWPTKETILNLCSSISSNINLSEVEKDLKKYFSTLNTFINFEEKTFDISVGFIEESDNLAEEIFNPTYFTNGLSKLVFLSQQISIFNSNVTKVLKPRYEKIHNFEKILTMELNKIGDKYNIDFNALAGKKTS